MKNIKYYLIYSVPHFCVPQSHKYEHCIVMFNTILLSILYLYWTLIYFMKFHRKLESNLFTKNDFDEIC